MIDVDALPVATILSGLRRQDALNIKYAVRFVSDEKLNGHQY